MVHDDEQTVPEQATGQLAAVLELAVIVARTGLRAEPPIEPPAPLRPFMRFTRRAPAPALRAARKVLDADGEFRARVASIATDDLVGAVGRLYVARPVRWVEEIRSLLPGSDPGGTAGAPADDRRLERRVVGAESAAQRAEQALARTRAELTAATAALAEERRLRLRAEEDSGALRATVTAADTERLAAQARADEAVQRAMAAAATRDDALARLSLVEAELQRRDGLDGAVSLAVAAVDRLAVMLRSLRDGGPHEERRTTGPPTGAAAKKASARRHRSPVRLPPGVLDDSPDAAAHLLHTADALVLVDGYNVAKRRWPEAAPAELRARLLGVMSAVSQRSRATVHVVFDGAFEASTAMRRSVGARVRTSFTSAGVEADDAIIDLVARTPHATAVVVVSDDRRVRDGVAVLGANVVPVAAFLAACGASER